MCGGIILERFHQLVVLRVSFVPLACSANTPTDSAHRDTLLHRIATNYGETYGSASGALCPASPALASPALDVQLSLGTMCYYQFPEKAAQATKPCQSARREGGSRTELHNRALVREPKDASLLWAAGPTTRYVINM